MKISKPVLQMARAVILIFCAVFAQQAHALDLPPEAQRDLLITQLAEHLKNERWKEAYPLFPKIEAILAGHNLPQDPSLFFYKGETAYKLDKPGEAQSALARYIKIAGSGGKFYTRSLKMIGEIQPKVAQQEWDLIREGRAYYFGLRNQSGGSKVDYKKAKDYFEQAAAMGNTEAACFLGLIYRQGNYGVKADRQKALEWFERGIRKKDICAMFEGANTYYSMRKYEDAQKLLLQIVVLPDPGWDNHIYARLYRDSYHNAALNFLRGLGSKQSFANAVKLLKQYADKQGWPQTTWTLLGEAYENLNQIGNLPKPDYAEAARWYRKAAQEECIGNQSCIEKSDPTGLVDHTSRSRLAVMYLEGRGVAKNPKQALKLLKYCEISDIGYTESYYCGLMHKEGLGVEPDFDFAAELLAKAVHIRPLFGSQNYSHGNKIKILANYHYAELLELGLGVDKDLKKALEHYKQAINLNEEVRAKILELAAQVDEQYIANMPYLERNGKRAGVITTETGLQYEYVNRGADNSMQPKGLLDQVTVHYTISRTNGEVVDSTATRGPAKFNPGSLVWSFREALLLMRVGDKIKVTVPYDPTGGGYLRGIPKGEISLYEIELLKVDPYQG